MKLRPASCPSGHAAWLDMVCRKGSRRADYPKDKYCPADRKFAGAPYDRAAEVCSEGEVLTFIHTGPDIHCMADSNLGSPPESWRGVHATGRGNTEPSPHPQIAECPTSVGLAGLLGSRHTWLLARRRVLLGESSARHTPTFFFGGRHVPLAGWWSISSLRRFATAAKTGIRLGLTVMRRTRLRDIAPWAFGEGTGGSWRTISTRRSTSRTCPRAITPIMRPRRRLAFRTASYLVPRLCSCGGSRVIVNRRSRIRTSAPGVGGIRETAGARAMGVSLGA